MTTFYVPQSMGWGNVALHIADLVKRCPTPKVHSKNFTDVVRGVEFSGFEITDDPNEPKFQTQLFINPHYFHEVHSNLKNILRPTQELQEILSREEHGCTHGIHIRRGACSKDSEDMGCHGKDENGQIKRAYFAQDSAIEKFLKIAEDVEGKVFLASDSVEIKKMFKDRFPDKIVTYDHTPSLTYKCEVIDNDTSREDRLACYVDWFLLSKCKVLHITAGNQDLSDFSTFGYSAGAYGGSNIHFIFN